MTSMEENKVKIFSYAKVWKVEKKIYSISNIPLPVPINPYDLLAFLGVALVVMIISNIIPGIGKVPVVIRYVAIPYCSVHYLMKKSWMEKIRLNISWAASSILSMSREDLFSDSVNIRIKRKMCR